MTCEPNRWCVSHTGAFSPSAKSQTPAPSLRDKSLDSVRKYDASINHRSRRTRFILRFRSEPGSDLHREKLTSPGIWCVLSNESGARTRTVSSAQLILLQSFIFYQCLMAGRNGRIMPLYTVLRPPPSHIFIVIAPVFSFMCLLPETDELHRRGWWPGLITNDGVICLFMRTSGCIRRCVCIIHFGWQNPAENGTDWSLVRWDLKGLTAE
jgi:hypothetical protein